MVAQAIDDTGWTRKLGFIAAPIFRFANLGRITSYNVCYTKLLRALETAGGVNLAQDAPSVRGTNIAFYGKERILSHAHEIDVFLAQNGAMNQPSIRMIKHEPGFDVIRAVKDDQIFIVDEKIVSRPTMRNNFV